MMLSERPADPESARARYNGAAPLALAASSPSAGPRIRVIAELEELRSLESAHQELLASASAPHVGTAFPYVIADAATGSAEQPWRMIAAYRDDVLAGCLYGRRRERAVIRMQMPVFELGTRFVADPLLGCGEQGETLCGLIEALQESQPDCAMFVFPRLSAASFDQLVLAAGDLGLAWQSRWSSYAYAFDTTVQLDEFLANLDGKQRRELNRRIRRLARDRATEFLREECLGVEEDMKRFEAFMAIEDSGWKGSNGTSIKRRPGYEPYFRELVRSASRCGLLVWYTLRVGQQSIAMYLALRTRDTLWLPKIGYDERYAEHAPGMVLKHKVLLQCIADPAIRRVDNLSAVPWVRLWQPFQIPFRSLTLFSRSPRSRFVYGVLSAKHLARRLVGKPEVVPGPGDRPFV